MSYAGTPGCIGRVKKLRQPLLALLARRFVGRSPHAAAGEQRATATPCATTQTAAPRAMPTTACGCNERPVVTESITAVSRYSHVVIELAIPQPACPTAARLRPDEPDRAAGLSSPAAWAGALTSPLVSLCAGTILGHVNLPRSIPGGTYPLDR